MSSLSAEVLLAPKPPAQPQAERPTDGERVAAGTVVRFCPTATGRPLFVVAGCVLIFTELASYLAEGQPVVGLQGLPLDASVPAVAAAYLRAMFSVQGEGPYHLAGWSTGGVIAYEMAVQLLAQGRKLGSLIILDEFAPLAVPLTRRCSWHWRRFRSRSWRERGAYLKRSLVRRKQMIQRRLGFGPDLMAEFKGIKSYRPLPFPGSVTIVRASESVQAADPRAEDWQFGWGPLVRGEIQTYTIAGTHGGILTGGNVAELAAILAKCTSRPRADAPA